MTASEIPLKTMIETKNAMEDIDDLSQDFSFCKTYQSPASLKAFIQKLLDGTSFSVVHNA